jgi:hypothetical protein
MMELRLEQLNEEIGILIRQKELKNCGISFRIVFVMRMKTKRRQANL